MSLLVAELQRQLGEGGINLIASFPSAIYDAAGPPVGYSANDLLPGAQSWIVVGSGGRRLWEAFQGWLSETPTRRLERELHPLDRYVARLLDTGDALFEEAGLDVRRFEPTIVFQPRIDFRHLAVLAGFGSSSPIGMVVHPEFGPWWALRGAWLVDAAIDPTSLAGQPCEGCPAPCRSVIAPGTEGTLAAATRAAREACPISAHRYTGEQLDYHYAPDASLLQRY